MCETHREDSQSLARRSRLCTSAEFYKTLIELCLPLRPPSSPIDIDIDLYASSVLDCINSNINSVITLKRITTFPNQKPPPSDQVMLG